MRRDRGSRLERRLVWILGSPRSGSTWLAGLLTTLTGGLGIAEPLIGLHLGALAADAMNVPAESFTDDQLRLLDNQAGARSYFFNAEFRDAWLPALRRLVLDRFGAQLSTMGDNGRRHIIVKEPNGSLAADVLLRAMPTSRLLFLLRDGRDVVDSQLDAAQPGAWSSEIGGGEAMSAERRLSYLAERAHRWRANTAVVTAAYESLPDSQRLLIRYEDLLADPQPQLTTALRWLGVDPPATMDEVIAERSFAALPDTGKGRFARAATPGLWRENLSAREQTLLGEILGETLSRLGYDA